MAAAGVSVYQFWRSKSQGDLAKTSLDMWLPTLYPCTADGPVSFENPQAGLWRIQVGGGYTDGVKQPKKYLPMQVWLRDPKTHEVIHIWRDGLELAGEIDFVAVTPERLAQRWIGAEYLSKADKDFYKEHGRWPEDPPPVSQSEAAPPPAKGSQPGDNAQSASAYDEMRRDIESNLAELQHHLNAKGIKDKPGLDMCENWRAKIAQSVSLADEMREEEKAPHWAKCQAIDAVWNTQLIKPARAALIRIKTTLDQWVFNEQERLRKEAAEAAKVKWDKEQAAISAARAEAEKQRAKMKADDPIAAATGSLPELPPEPEKEFIPPVIEAPKISMGTGTYGNKRSAKAPPATATIIDLKAAAAFYAEQQHPELVALIQTLGNKAAKANATVPGMRMSWEKKEATA